MSTSVSWPPIGGTTYSVPASGEVGWAALSDYLIALAAAQGTVNQKIGIRVATTSPVSVSSTTDCVIVSNLAVAGAVTVNLPAAVDGQVFMVIDGKGDATTNNITVDGNASETINGSTTYVINKSNSAVVLVAKSAAWYVAAEFNNLSAGKLPRNKIAAGTADYVVINDASGNLSEEAQLATTRGGTGVNSTATFPTSGVVLTRSSTDQGASRLQNKDLSDDNVAFVDEGDTSKKLKFQVSGVTTGTTRTATTPDADFTMVGTATTQTITNKTIAGASNTLTVRAASDITGQLPLANGGTAGTSATTGFNNLSPVTTKGDIITRDTTNNIRLAVGTNGQVLTADSGETAGIKWATPDTALFAPDEKQNYSIAPSVAANALTIALKDAAGSNASAGSPVKIQFKNNSLTSDTNSTVSVTGALSLVVPDTATLGHISGEDEPIYVYAINNAGTAELAISTTLLDENVIHTTTTIATSSDSRTGKYSTTGRTDVSVRFLGLLKSNQATAGTYATAIALVSSTGLDSSPVSHIYRGLEAPKSAQVGLTVTGTNWTTTRAQGIAYEDGAGVWRFKFNIDGSISVGATSLTLSLVYSGANVTFKTGFSQAVAAAGNVTSTFYFGATNGGTNNIDLFTGSSTTNWRTSGDVELDAKPTGF